MDWEQHRAELYCCPLLCGPSYHFYPHVSAHTAIPIGVTKAHSSNMAEINTLGANSPGARSASHALQGAKAAICTVLTDVTN